MTSEVNPTKLELDLLPKNTPIRATERNYTPTNKNVHALFVLFE